MVKQSEWITIAARINDDYASQREWLLASLLFFSAWLVAYLLYWVLVNLPEETTK